MATNNRKTAIVVLAAGLGTRMKSRRPKVMHPLAGRPMISHLMDSLSQLNPARIVVVVGPEMETLTHMLAPHPTVIQAERLGTGHAVLAARSALADFDGDLLVAYGDTPLIGADTLANMLECRAATPAPGVVVLGFRPDDPGHYGRLVLDDAGGLQRIVEYRDAGPDERAIPLCNSGLLAADARTLFGWLDRVRNDNAKGEYYLTDVVALARADGQTCAVVEGHEDELLGINSRTELAQAEERVQQGLRRQAMDNGATLTDPSSVFFCHDTRLGRDVTVEPNVVFGPGVRVGDAVTIRAFSHLEGAEIGDGAVIGPFARLRPGAHLAEQVRIGNFVEIKNARLEVGAKVNHLTYVGDAMVGPRANLGAGTITCNYDGFRKSQTRIGADAFIGSNTALVAPVTVGDGAVIGAGSVITHDVADDALAVTRAKQREVNGWAAEKRRREQDHKKKP